MLAGTTAGVSFRVFQPFPVLALQGSCWKATTPEHLRRCKRGYPKDVNPVTTIDEHGYPIYRRRSVADLDVIPHNPRLCLMFDCHINVELAHTVHLIKYLHNYCARGATSSG